MSRNATIVLLLALLVGGAVLLGILLTRPSDVDLTGGNGTPTPEDGSLPEPGPMRAGLPGSVSGEVHILSTQEPAAGIEVEITGGGEPIYTETDRQGRFAGEAPSEVELTIRVVAPAPYATLMLRGITVEPGKINDLGTLYLEKAFLVKGEVVDPRGRRLPGARVTAHRPAAGEANLNILDIITSLGSKRVPLEATVTAEDGSFVLSGLSPGTYRLEAEAEGFAPGFLPGAVVSPESANHVFRIVVAPGSQLEGTVRRPDESPVAGALVTTLRFEQRSFQELDFRPVQVTTDEQGQFLFANLRPGQVGLMVTAEGYPMSIVERAEVGSGKRVDVVLGGDAAVAGKVSDSAGEPVEGAEVMIAVGNRGGSFGRALTDAEGRYRMENLNAGPVQFATVRKAGYPTWPAQADMFSMRRGFGELKAGETLEKNVTLSEGTEISGIVTDSATGRAVARAEVTLRTMGGMVGMGTGGSAITDENGSYRISGVGEGSHLLLVKAAGYFQEGLDPANLGQMFQPTRGNSEAPADGPLVIIPKGATAVTKNLTVLPGASIRGIVVDAENRPVGGAKVTFAGAGNEMAMLTRMMGVSSAAVLTNADGEFRIDGASAGEKVKLAASAQGFVESFSEELSITAGAEVSGVVIKLGTGGTLSGTVLGSDGQPLSDATVKVVSFKRNERDREWVPTWQLNRAEGHMTDGEGSFSITGLKPGPILVGVEAPGHQMLVKKDLTVAEAQVTGGQVFALERGLTISGRLLGEDGKAVSSANLWVSRQPNPGEQPSYNPGNRGRVNADGSFEIDRLTAGSYTLTVTAAGYVQEQVKDVAAGTTNLQVRLAKGLSISGRVVLPDGTPAIDTWIRARGEDDRQGGAQTNEKGEFEIKGLGRGAYAITAQINAWAGMRRGETGEAPNVRSTTLSGVAAGTENVEIRLLPGVAIEGVVVDTEGNPISQGTLFARPEGGENRPESRAMAAEDGTFRVIGLDEGEYKISAWKAGYMQDGESRANGGARGVRVVLKVQEAPRDPVRPVPVPR
jgi:protocatechuate 3,4-dioxygenase beta subunit